MSRPLPPGAPSVEAHAALVDCALALVRRVDPALEPLLVVGWISARQQRNPHSAQAPSTFTCGSALFVPAGAWHTPTSWSTGDAPHCASARRAPQALAVLRFSAALWPELSPTARGETIAHELAHLSDLRETIGHLPPREASAALRDHSGHGIGWIRWTYRYAGRVLPARSSLRRDLTGEAAHDHGAVVVQNDLEKIYAA